MPYLKGNRRRHHRQLPRQNQRDLGSWPRSKPTRTQVPGHLCSQTPNPECGRWNHVSLRRPLTAGRRHVSGEIRHRPPAVTMDRKTQQVTDLHSILPLASLSGSRSRKPTVPVQAVAGEVSQRHVRVPCTNWSTYGEGKKVAPSLLVGPADHPSGRSQSHKNRKNLAAQANFCSRLLVHRQSRALLRRSSSLHRDPPILPSRGTPIARPRPQSMFLNSPTTAAVKFPVPSPIDGGSTNLDVPSPDTRSQRTRRTSISDMVQRYEAMGGSGGGGGGSAAPSPASRQANTSTFTQMGASSLARSTTTRVSPPPGGAAALSPVPRQPNTSTQLGASSLSRSTTTHVSPSRRSQLSAVGLPGLAADPSKKPVAVIGVSDKPRAEHASPIGLPGLAAERKSSVAYTGRRSPIKTDATAGAGVGGGGLDAPMRPIPMRSFSPAPPAMSDDVQSPSPEKPYQGVGRLIDEWQRKTADAEAPRSPVSRRRGDGGIGTGATASPRRAGVIAGRGAQD